MQFSTYFAAISLATLASHPAAAQDIDLRSLLSEFERVRVDEVTGDNSNFMVRTSRQGADGGAVAAISIGCRLATSRDAMLIIYNHAEKTDDRIGVESGVCHALLAAARQRKETQKP